MSWSDHLQDHLQKLKDMVVEADPVSASPPTATADLGSSAACNVPVVASAAQAAVSVTQATSQSVPTDGFLAKLRSKLANPNSAVDKFEATLASLNGAIPEAGMRLQATLSVLKTTAGIDAAQVRTEYNGRLNALELQCGQFRIALNGQRANEVTARESDIANTTAAIDAKNKEIQVLAMKRDSLNQEIITAKTKLAGAQAGFDGAVATIKAEIQDAVSRLGSASTTGAGNGS